LLVIPAAVVLAAALFTYSPPPPTYNVGVRFLVGQEPSPAAEEEDEERYYAWLTSEYVVNGLTDWTQSGAFAEAVSERMAERGRPTPPGAVRVAADNARSMLTLSLSHQDPELLALLMEAAITVLQEENAQGLPLLDGETAVVVQLDDPVVTPVPAGLRAQLDLPLRILLALGAGVGLALLAEYLDPTIRDRTAVDELEIPILGEIPKS
jgi:capsular polysaccharide biosynthesis protein